MSRCDIQAMNVAEWEGDDEEYPPQGLIDDPLEAYKFAAQAVENIRFLSLRLRNDREFVEALIDDFESGYYLEYAGDKVKNDPEMVMKALFDAAYPVNAADLVNYIMGEELLVSESFRAEMGAIPFDEEWRESMDEIVVPESFDAGGGVLAPTGFTYHLAPDGSYTTVCRWDEMKFKQGQRTKLIFASGEERDRSDRHQSQQ